ncbi:DMT family transporter [Granulosicoccus antarcticus]|uniref:Putative amino-acid metabolite efflux pump n=1 Tax=Granulosicoccus antarcticus IMCC3135 TaxID=1192854 RepID=A0A2Z2NQ72_9GAMM|nr:DMT family transporter [Granulosicoccus antarcticus]ASJ72625.1 putative amino-acid metabolite efflux pump [Granulosicoccus antarcticus IMCC3135]
MKILIACAPGIFLLLWSGGFTVAKIGISDADPLTLLALRYACVVVILLPFCLIIKPPLPKGRQQWLNLALVGFLIQVAYFGTAWMAFYKGGSAGTVALITSLQPILVALIMPMMSSERVSIKRWLGLALGLAGTSLVLAGNAGIEPISLTVLVFSTSALIAFTIATVWEKRFGVAHHPLTSNMVQYTVGLAGTLPLALLFEPMHIEVTVPFLFALAYLVLGNSLLAISLLLMMIRRGEATRVSALFFLVPPVSALIAWLVLDEHMSSLAWLGMAVAAIGVWMTTRRVV